MLTNERANELLRYNSDTGKLYWKVRRKRANAGAEAGTLRHQTTNTYRLVWIDGKPYYAHRIVWFLHYSVWPEGEIDHIDGDGLNNSIENLRDVSHRENMKNQRMYRNNASGVTGVYWCKERCMWRALIYIDGKRKHVGYFANIDEAAVAYRKAAAELGFTERHGGEG